VRIEVRTPRILNVSTMEEFGVTFVIDLLTVGAFNRRLRII